MDVWVHGGALVALWVIAVALVVLVLVAWGLLVQVLAIRRKVAPEVRVPDRFAAVDIAKGPAQSGD